MKFYISRYTNLTDKMIPCEEASQDENGRWYIEIHSMPQDFIELLMKYQMLRLESDLSKQEFSMEIMDNWSHEA